MALWAMCFECSLNYECGSTFGLTVTLQKCIWPSMFSLQRRPHHASSISILLGSSNLSCQVTHLENVCLKHLRMHGAQLVLVEHLPSALLVTSGCRTHGLCTRGWTWARHSPWWRWQILRITMTRWRSRNAGWMLCDVGQFVLTWAKNWRQRRDYRQMTEHSTNVSI